MSKELFISSSPHETKVAVFEDDELVEVYHERDTGIGLAGGIYKGRVSRVLPGMQSAFVDVGLDRDAFLYVSDFFEDSDEYDKVVSEAEARVSRYTADATREGGAQFVTVRSAQTEGPGAEGEAVAGGAREMTGGVAAATPPPLGTIGPAPSQPTPVPTATTDVPAPAASQTSAAPQVPTRPAGGPSGHEKPQYGDRGRRRRRGGRGFGERERRFGPKPGARDRYGSPSDRQSGPPHERPAGPPHGFEILPGESLAKYTRGTSDVAGPATSADSSVGPPEPGAPPEQAQFAPEAASEERRGGTTSGVPPESQVTSYTPSEPFPAREAEGSQWPSSPSPRSDAGSLPSGTEKQKPSSTVPFSREPEPEPGQGNQSRPAISGSSTVAAAEFPTEGQPTARDRVTSPMPVPEPVPEHSAPYTAAQAPSALQDASGAEALAPEQVSELSAAPSGARDEASSSAAPDGGGPAEFPGPPVRPAALPENPAEPAERSYTLREPHHRPRFAPRRGRRGQREREPRPRGGPSYAPESSRSGNNQPVQISELLKEGQEILVQIAKEPLGNKGARITSHIALPGRYLVYMPTIHHIGVSRKITSEEERLRLRNIILENRGALTGGIIVRTAGAGRSDEELKADLKYLSTLWNDIRAKAERTKAPALLHRDLDLVQRILRDILSPDFKSIRVDNEAEYERILDFVSRSQPSLVGHVKLWNRETSLFEEFGIQAEIDKALRPKVWLKSGGFIVINQTEALVAVDVNTGKYVGKTNRLEDTIVKTNIDAVKEIVRQIRLRDLGGIIVIDFIDMDERRNRQKVVQALEEALRHDRAPTSILSINEFGLVALTRKRVKQSLERTLCEPCHYCSGAGWIKSPGTVCLEILAEARKMASHVEGKSLTLRINPEVAHRLKSREGALLSELEAITGKDVIIKSDPSVHQERFEIF